MPQEACRLCKQINKTFGHTINDKLITQFLSNAVIRLNTADKNKNVCNVCYAKAKIVVDFVTLVNKTQNLTPQTSSPSKIAITSVHDSLSSTTNFVAIKQEHIDSPDVFYNEFGDDSNYYEDDNQSEPEVQSKNVREKFKWPNHKKLKKKALPQDNTFKCSNCKKDHENFKELEAHIADCFKSTIEFKCFVCDKQLETRKKLYSHMETHKVYNKKGRDRSDSPKKLKKIIKPQTVKLKCNQCTTSFNSSSDLIKHTQEVHNEGYSNDSNNSLKRQTRNNGKDKSEALLEKARRLIDEIN